MSGLVSNTLANTEVDAEVVMNPIQQRERLLYYGVVDVTHNVGFSNIVLKISENMETKISGNVEISGNLETNAWMYLAEESSHSEVLFKGDNQHSKIEGSHCA